MTRSFLTVRTGATVTHVHCKDMAAMWVTHLIAATGVHADVQGPISVHAPGDNSAEKTEHILTTCTDGVGVKEATYPDLSTTSYISGTTSGSALASSTAPPLSTTSYISETTSGSALPARPRATSHTAASCVQI